MDESLKSYWDELRWIRFRKCMVIAAIIPPLPAMFITPFPFSILMLGLCTLIYVLIYQYLKKLKHKIRVLKMAIYWRQLELKLKLPDSKDQTFKDIVKILGNKSSG
jgi:hypothetical protein